MIVLPLIYFLLLTGYFFWKNGWGLDVAASFLLVFVSAFAIVIDVKDLYGDYGINRMAYNLGTILLFCMQWTLVLMPLHEVSALKIDTIDEVKIPSLKILCVVMLLC